MTKDYGIKITIPGEATTTTDPRKILMSSAMPMLKHHSDTATTITIAPGGTTGSVDVNHSLGYVPAFMAYTYCSEPYIQGASNSMSLIPVIPDIKSGNPYILAYATSSKIHVDIKLPDPWNEVSDSYYVEDQYDEKVGTRNYIVTGHKNGDARNHAVRFTDIDLDKNQSIISAQLQHYAEYRWVSSPAADMKLKTYGIDEDDTGDFSSNPMGRTKTTAVTSQTQVVPSASAYFGTDVKTSVEEIIARGSWSSGNAMGFLVFDDAGPDGNAIEDDSDKSQLDITYRLTGNLVFDIRVIIFKDKIAT